MPSGDFRLFLGTSRHGGESFVKYWELCAARRLQELEDRRLRLVAS